MLQLPSDQLVTTPFCALGTPVTDFVLPPIVGNDGSLIQTQQFGIPPVQEKDPELGGLPVRRDETNGVLQFYSNVLFFMNQGGQFTFDLDQSTAIGGYSEGAVLFDFATSSYVISLIDNNTFDFVTTPGYIDGIKWQKQNINDISISKRLTVAGSPGTFEIIATTTKGPFPTNSCRISGLAGNGAPQPPGTVFTFIMDLVAAGILSSTPNRNSGPCSAPSYATGASVYAAIGISASTNGTDNNLYVTGVNPSSAPGSVFGYLNFSIDIAP